MIVMMSWCGSNHEFAADEIEEALSAGHDPAWYILHAFGLIVAVSNVVLAVAGLVYPLAQFVRRASQRHGRADTVTILIHTTLDWFVIKCLWVDWIMIKKSSECKVRESARDKNWKKEKGNNEQRSARQRTK